MNYRLKRKTATARRVGTAVNILLVSIISLAAMAHPAYAASREEIIKGVEERFSSIRSFTASFRQKFYNAALDETEDSSGTVALEKPLKMRWNYREPETQLLITDGQKLYFYVPADRQVIVEKLKNILGARSPLLFLAGEKRLEELFTISLADTANKDKITGFELELEPKEKSMSVTRVTIRVDAKDFTIKSFTLYDWTGNRTDVFLEDMEINNELVDGTFVFDRPRGVEIMESPTMDFGDR